MTDTVFDPVMYIAMRADLKIPKGKAAVQAAHAAVGVYVETLRLCEIKDWPDREIIAKWIDGLQTKICIKAKDLNAIHDLETWCKNNSVPYCVIRDAGRTVFPEPTVTCIGIGPVWRKDAKHLATMPLY